MKRIFVLALLIITNFSILCLALPYDVAAADNAKTQFFKGLSDTAAETGHTKVALLNKQNPAEVIGAVIKILLGLTGVFFLFLMIYGGYIWMLARGNDQEVGKAKSIITNAIIGLAIVFCAYAITATVSKIIK